MTALGVALFVVSLAHCLYFSSEASLEEQVSGFRSPSVAALRMRPLVTSRNMSAVCVAASVVAPISRLG